MCTQTSPEYISVFFSINDTYAPHLCATLASILKNSQSEFSFHILNQDVRPETQQIIRSLSSLRPFRLEFIKIDSSIFGDFKMTVPHISIEACYRFMIPQLKPNMKKALYLDSDLVVLDDLKKIWDIDLGGAYCAAVEDYTPCESEGRRILFQGIRYFNSGVMLLNLDKIREHFVLDDYLAIEKKHRANFWLLDQDALNLAYKDNVTYLPAKWNVTYVHIEMLLKQYGGVTGKFKAAFETPAICHFAGSQKPWVAPYGVNAQYYAEAYFTYLRMTPYASLEARIYEDFPAWRTFFRKLFRTPKFFIRPAYRRRCQFRRKYERDFKYQ